MICRVHRSRLSGAEEALTNDLQTFAKRIRKSSKGGMDVPWHKGATRAKAGPEIGGVRVHISSRGRPFDLLPSLVNASKMEIDALRHGTISLSRDNPLSPTKGRGP